MNLTKTYGKTHNGVTIECYSDASAPFGNITGREGDYKIDRNVYSRTGRTMRLVTVAQRPTLDAAREVLFKMAS